MVSIDQVKLLESRVIKTIDFVDQVTEENALLKNKLESCQKRIDELEILIQRFKEDQAKIEDGIVSALDRLNKFEDDMDKGSNTVKAEAHSSSKRSRAAATEDNSEEGFVLKDKPFDPNASEENDADASSELDIY
ncbi:MAG: cell division protein ZapB [Spirochaetaceae bacterium]|jgi:chromosome segregation ATPase|nr:cell division protein ZapB [Spirochaetaceae bacterium]